MPALSGQPTIYEINTPIFLRELSQQAGSTISLATVPDEVWDDIAARGTDAVWFMGVWRRSERSVELSRDTPWFKEVLPDISPTDVIGSAYSISAYVVDDLLGGDEALAVARQKLHQRGVSIILDFVPNHTAIDHHWVNDHPEYYLQGSTGERDAHPGAFVESSGRIFANGRDPKFPPWSDVLQINAFSLDARAATIETLKHIGTMCDGVRCDMAMLLMNDIFAKTWGTRAGRQPNEDYWPVVISAVKSLNPDFCFIAEVYWGRERALLEQGFDFCYDKLLYDHLLEGTARDVSGHIHRAIHYQKHLIRFLENHDEERTAAVLPFGRHRAAAVIMATLPGAHLYHDGQLTGRRVRVPVHLSRRQPEVTDERIEQFYQELFLFIQRIKIDGSEWGFVDVRTRFGRASRSILAWQRNTPSGVFIVAVNYTDRAATGVVSKTKVALGPWEYRIMGMNGKTVETVFMSAE